MADKKINRGIRSRGQLFVPGQEDELNDELTKDQVKVLKERGAIEGDFTGSDEEAPKRKQDDGEKDPTLRASKRQRAKRKRQRESSKKRKPRKREQVESDLPEDFPGRLELAKAGITDEDGVVEQHESDEGLEGVDGIGTATKKEIMDRLELEEENEEGDE